MNSASVHGVMCAARKCGLVCGDSGIDRPCTLLFTSKMHTVHAFIEAPGFLVSAFTAAAPSVWNSLPEDVRRVVVNITASVPASAEDRALQTLTPPQTLCVTDTFL